ncbi:unnamed protein product [Clonostachys solani]|uniref:Uncharacterized protein n=1 Tax=Clonostachys solani TaxID=160281 RepID=A0A9N9YZH8_9HYPO|nr:unnamed protein product [Clonostachys solani]
MPGKRKNRNFSRPSRQAPRFFPSRSAFNTPNQGAASQNEVAAPQVQVEASQSQVAEPKSQVEVPPTEAAMPPTQVAASADAERERLNLKMKDNAWARALLTSQIKQTQRDIMRTKLLGTYEKATGDLLSEFILKLHKRDRELEQLEAEMKKLGPEEGAKAANPRK